MRPLRDHRVNEDEADRHSRPRHVPTLAALAVAMAAIALLGYLHAKGVTW
jgi:hypothetical protein